MELIQQTLTTPLSDTATLTGYVLDNSPEIDPQRQRPAVIICPGGGYEFLSDREAEPVAIHFAAAGVQAFILRYSVAPARFPVALLEMAQALATVRANAAAWHVDPQRIIAAGFSAGAHVAASLGVYWDQKLLADFGFTAAQIQPNGLLLSYPVITAGKYCHEGSIAALLGERKHETEARAEVSLEHHVSAATPKTFLWSTFTDDVVPMENALLFAKSLRANQVPFELHIFPEGHHGLSLATAETASSHRDTSVQPEVTVWPDLFMTWLHHQLPAGTTSAAKAPTDQN
ncbi:alpha/beta hydrolase [Lapidilactobacillus achengensis]|uniref:Alpha/beta hydrolase n=1 Tax=Lapidilactobacillus achengensis TaxID=2486000 RepID=A0ABW1UM03_9LACO|nr:alpha/beta hydrolase [Lapidilactobacillus achengensis]